MAENSKIEWCHHTANLWHGCTPVHAGCDFCYAEALTHRWGRDLWGNDKPRMEIKSVWKDLDKFQKLAKEAGEIHRVFVGSMMDLFEKEMPLVDSKGVPDTNQNTGNLRFHLFYRIDRGDYPNLLFLFLTKRPSNINKMIFESWKENSPKNVMFGCSVSDQKTARDLLPHLMKVRGSKYVSAEPLLGGIDFEDPLLKPKDGISYGGINWLIVGGESGHKARPTHPNYVQSLKEQCDKANIPFFFKQWGEWVTFDQMPSEEQLKLRRGESNHKIQSFSDGELTYHLHKLGKHKSGNFLDGKQYLQYPTL